MNDTFCKQYLADLKWHDGFRCTKCGDQNVYGKKDEGYLCYNCNQIESARARARALFDKVHFGLGKACALFLRGVLAVKGSPAHKWTNIIASVRSPYVFIHKVRKAMEGSQKWPLSKLVHLANL